MRSSNQQHITNAEVLWRGPRYDDQARRPYLDLVAAKVGFYRREAGRLLGLAASSPFAEAKRQFLDLAQQYEMLAEHAERRLDHLT